MRRLLSLGALFAVAFAIVPATNAHAAVTSTTTVIEAPNQFGVESNMQIRVQVTADSGATAPTGNVTIYNNLGAHVASYSLTATDNGGYSWATFTWSSPTLGRNTLKAVYSPDTKDFVPSQSTYAGIQILTSTPLAVLRMPDRFVVGTQANLVLVITPGTGGGTATFNVNNDQIYASTPLTNGQIAFPWTPAEPIPYVFVSNYSNAAGNASQQMRQSMLAYSN